MNEQQFWTQLQQLIYPSEIAQAQWERLVQLHTSPPLATQLIIQTSPGEKAWTKALAHYALLIKSSS